MTTGKSYSRRAFLGTAAAGAGLLAAPATLRGQGVNLRLHHFNSPLSIAHTKFLVPWAEQLAEATDGELQIEVFPAMQLGGKPPQLADQTEGYGTTDLEKEAWLSEVLLEWGSCGRVVYVGGAPAGYVLFAPPASVPRATEMPTGPVSADAVLLTTMQVAP